MMIGSRFGGPLISHVFPLEYSVFAFEVSRTVCMWDNTGLNSKASILGTVSL
jgi:hypothetical protein